MAEDQSLLLAHYERIIKISRQLNSTYDRRELLMQIVTAAADIANCEAASILLIDPISGELRFEIATNMDPAQAEAFVIPLEGSIAGWIASHGEPRIIHDTTQEPGHFQDVDQSINFRTRNLLGVPMRAHTEVIGVLEVVNKQNGEKFTDVDLSTLTTLASQAAVAIENARLFRQSDFIAQMVHELRTPLMALRASTSSLLRSGVNTNQQRDIINTMQEETDRLLNLTTDFLDVAQMESGRARLQRKPFEVHPLVEESVEVVRPQAAERGISFSTDMSEAPLTITGDRDKLKQVMLNLLTNAIKYNRPEGRIEVTVHPVQDDHMPVVQIIVRDTGYGMSRRHLTQIFDKFFRAPDTAQETSGTGLGLSITRHIVLAHGGKIWAESQEGVGTAFSVMLPLPADSTA